MVREQLGVGAGCCPSNRCYCVATRRCRPRVPRAGMTNAGKTYTVTGPTNQPGLLPRTLAETFQHLDRRQWRVGPEGGRVSVLVSYLEIYNEQVYDLLAAFNPGAAGGAAGGGGGSFPAATGPTLRTAAGFTREALVIKDGRCALARRQRRRKGCRRRLGPGATIPGLPALVHACFSLALTASTQGRPRVRPQPAPGARLDARRGGGGDARGHAQQAGTSPACVPPRRVCACPPPSVAVR
jgi:hypothetical protein